MSKFVIEGGTRLKGKVNIGGFKNAAVAIIPATLLCTGKCIIQNVPKIEDVNVYRHLKLGAFSVWHYGRGCRDLHLP